MELLLVIAAAAAFLLLVKHAKDNGFSERTFNLKTRQNEVADLERKGVRLCSDLQMQLQELQALSPSAKPKPKPRACESKREAQVDDLAQGARNRLGKAEEKLSRRWRKPTRSWAWPTSGTGNRWR